MKQENQIKLVNDFPNLYRQHNLPMDQTCMCWGFECPDQWFDIIYQLSEKLDDIAKREKITIEACQVKEKFGGLRFYLDPMECSKEASDEIFATIDEAEKLVNDL